MERLNIKYLILLMLLTSCQILEVTDNESIELIPDLSIPENEEAVEANQIIEVDNFEPFVEENISIWEILKSEAVIKDYEIDGLTLYYMNQHLKNVDLFENYLENSYYFLYYVV